MAKRTHGNSGNKSVEAMLKGGSFESLRSQAAQNVMRARSFGPFDFAVKDNRDILDRQYTMEVDLEGKPERASWLELQEAAKAILTANFCKRIKADEDRGWVKATWSVGNKAQKAGLDPTVEFEVGVARSRKPDPQRGLNALDLVSLCSKHSGLGLSPDKDGDHLDIPGMGILYTSDLVVVTRGGNDLALCSFAEGLLQSGASTAQWGKLLPSEEKALKQRRLAEGAEKKMSEDANDAFDLFLDVAAEEEDKIAAEKKQEEERKRREEEEKRRAAWTVLTMDAELVAAWGEVLVGAKATWEDSRAEVEMILGVVRPGKPSTEAVRELYNAFSPRAFNSIASWVKESYPNRQQLAQSVVLAREAFPEKDGVGSLISPKLFRANGEVIPELKQLEGYATQAEWVTAASEHLTEKAVAKFEEKVEEVYSQIQQTT